MHLLEHLHRNVKTVAMPTAMVVGALLCRPISALEELSGQMITPTLIFLMLFVTFCRVKPSQMKPSMLHVWLLLVQTVACIGVFLLLRPLDLILAQGAMVCVLAPVAMAAVVIGGMLGANVATMATYSLLCNMAVALLAPVILTFTGTGACTFAQILARIAPLLVMPFAAAQFCRLVIPKAAKWVGAPSQISFYMWLASTCATLRSRRNCGWPSPRWLSASGSSRWGACWAAVTATLLRADSLSGRKTRSSRCGWPSRSSTRSPRSPPRRTSCGRIS